MGLGGEGLAALATELACQAIIRSALRARVFEPRAALGAKDRVGQVLVLAAQAPHVFPFKKLSGARPLTRPVLSLARPVLPLSVAPSLAQDGR